MPYVPSWIKPANPAAQWARGFPTGVALEERREEGARRAQEFAIQQAMQEARLAAQTQEKQQQAVLEEKYFTEKAKAAAEKSAAILEYRQRVRDGEDPMKVMLELGPAMGQSGAEAAVIRSQAMLQAARERAEARSNDSPPESSIIDGQRWWKTSTPSGGTSWHMGETEFQKANLEARDRAAEVQAAKGRQQAATATMKALLNQPGVGAFLMLPESAQQERLKTHPELGKAKEQYDQAQQILADAMKVTTDTSTGDEDVDESLMPTAPKMAPLPADKPSESWLPQAPTGLPKYPDMFPAVHNMGLPGMVAPPAQSDPGWSNDEGGSDVPTLLPGAAALPPGAPPMVPLRPQVPTGMGAPSSPASEILRITKDGRQAAFDPVTKQFIRYLNDSPPTDTPTDSEPPADDEEEE